MAKQKSKYAETPTQKKESQILNGIGGTVVGGTAGGYTAEAAMRRRKTWRDVHFVADPARRFGLKSVYGPEIEIQRAGFARRLKETAAKKTAPRPNPKFNQKRWEKVENLYNRTSGGEHHAAGAAKARMLAGGEGPTLKGSRNPLWHAAKHIHPGVTATAAGLGVAGATGLGVYALGRASDKHYTHPVQNRVAAERKEAMSKSAFGVVHEDAVSKKHWNPETKSKEENVVHGARKGAVIGGVVGGTLGAGAGATVGGPGIAALSGVEGGVKGALAGSLIGAGHGALRTNKEKIKKGMDLKPLVFNSNGQMVGHPNAKGEQRDPKGGPFGVPKGPVFQLKQRPKSNTLDSSADIKPSGVQGRGKGKDKEVGTSKVIKAFDPMSDAELDEILKGFGMGSIKTAGAAVKGFTQYHGAGLANKATAGFQAAKPKLGAGLKLAAANPGKTALATAGVGGTAGLGAGFGMGRKKG